MSEKIAALVLAGGKIGPALLPYAEGVTNRALIPLNGRPMIDYVMEALLTGMESAGGGRVLLAGHDLPEYPGVAKVAGGVSLVDTLLNGVAALEPDETRLLVATADIPFLTPEAVTDFLAQAERVQPAGFVYPIVPVKLCDERFPAMRRTTLGIAEGIFTGGNIVLLNPAFLREKENTIRAAYELRKDVGALARLLGPVTLARMLLSRLFPAMLPIPVIEKAVSKLLGGVTARAIISQYPEIGADVDKPEDIEIARNLLKTED